MNFSEFRPHPLLAPFIDAYWDVTCSEGGVSIDKVLPDGCVDIIFNLGENYHIDCEHAILKNEKAYLGGTITHCMEAKTLPGTHLVGVRFKPSAFSNFYQFSSLHEVTNNFMELPKAFTPGIDRLKRDVSTALDDFFYSRLTQPKHALFPVIETVNQHQGNITVSKLAAMHCTTIRSLERNFKYYIGLSPKEFTNIIRYRFAQHLILKNHPERSLCDIAFECGYYDQAHLSNEIKKYTGTIPTQLII